MIDYSKERQPPYTRNLRYIPITDRRYAYSIGTESGVIVDRIKFNDWQEMALKKDTESIIKKLNSQEPIFFSLCWEIVLAMGAIIVDAQGVLNVLYNLYDPEAKVPRITRETVDDTLNCYNEHIHIVKRGHHTNLMAATKISPVAKQAEIDGHFRKKYHFYEIRIPKNLIN